GARRGHVPWRLAVAVSGLSGYRRHAARALELSLARPQDFHPAVPVPVVPGHLPPLPLRPDHAPRMEGAAPRDAGVDRRGDGACGVPGGTLVALKERRGLWLSILSRHSCCRSC